MSTYRKSRAFAPQGFFECEGRGLQWLGAAHAQGGPRVVQVYDWGKDYLDIERVNSSSPTAKAALNSARRSHACMMPVPNISVLRRKDMTAHATSGHCRIR